MSSPRSLSGVAILILFSVMLSGCATDGSIKRWGQCALIGGGSGGVLGAAIEGGTAAAGGAAIGAVLGGLLCAFTDKDSDGDGVSDRYDLCRDTPSGVAVGESGCPLDSDNDGVPDYKDLCPGTPGGMRVNEHGCPDSDGDGVADNMDQCPNTPTGVVVDSKGCPVDSDSDGVPDGLDKCPNTMKGAPVDSHGCYLDVSENLGEVHFSFNEKAIDGASQQFLNKVAQKMKGNPDLKIRVYGYTDNTGEAAYNVELSQKRANAVRDYLVNQGIDTDRIKPLAGGVILEHNNTRAGRAANRKASLLTGEE
ncbi:OmpA family protein [Endozoicomonas montiporae]|uniref:OmpA/MotB n=1 Tax=Endozoicomonas montiporae CL-33 TaxID=570277 RepID=A0A142BER4_9GAMM|nr:OmpA family protein [Endozoicomonas montiporae]AMO57240.1 OmpA/MotB [Endozoicomonas montiporae CL-33]